MRDKLALPRITEANITITFFKKRTESPSAY